MIKIAFPSAWQEVAFVGITKAGGSEIQFAAITDSIEVNEGEYGGEGKPNLAGGRIWVQSPQEDGELTVEIYPLELDASTGVGLFQQWIGGTVDSSEPLASDAADVASVLVPRDRFRVSILWTNDTAATTASGATAASTDALRLVVEEARITAHETSFKPDEQLKITATFKFPAKTKAGTARSVTWQSGDNTALAALSSYT